MNEPIERTTVSGLVLVHDEAIKMALDGLNKIRTAKKLLTSHLGNYRDSIHEDEKRLLTRYVSEDDIRKEVTQYIQENFWRDVIKRTEIEKMMSSKERAKMERLFEGHTTPEFTVENVILTLKGLFDDRDNILQQTIVDCFKMLIVKDCDKNKHKTNKVGAVGSKVIVKYMVEWVKGWGFRLYHGSEPFFNDLDRAFHALDGKIAKQYPEDLGTIVRKAMDRKHPGDCETEYFSMRWFKTGTLHIVFKRLDLVAELNRIGSGGEAQLGN